jgi:hypothetical protein
MKYTNRIALRSQRKRWQLGLLSALLLFMLSASAFAESEEQRTQRNHTPSEDDMTETMLHWVNMFHEEISKGILTISERFDKFFGDERIEEERQDSQIHVATRITWAEESDPSMTFPINVDLAFPRLKDRVMIVLDTLLERDNDDKEPAEEGEESGDNDVQVKVRYKGLEKDQRWLSLDSGVKIYSDKLVPFGEIRARRMIDYDPWAMRLTQFVLWVEDDGFAETSRLDFERRFGENRFFRTTSAISCDEQTSGLQFTQSLYFRQRISYIRALGLEVSAQGVTSPSIVIDQYSVKLTYRRRIYRNWAYFALEPQLRFLHEDHYQVAPLTSFTLEIRFGKLPKLPQ